MKELIERAKAAPGKLNYGAGTITSQLMGFRFHKAAGIDIVYIPFKGTVETMNGLLTGSVQLIYASNVTVNPLIENGKIRALARLSRFDSHAATPTVQLPTLAEAAGLPCLVTGTLMASDDDKRRLASEVLAFARRLRETT